MEYGVAFYPAWLSVNMGKYWHLGGWTYLFNPRCVEVYDTLSKGSQMVLNPDNQTNPKHRHPPTNPYNSKVIVPQPTFILKIKISLAPRATILKYFIS